MHYMHVQTDVSQFAHENFIISYYIVSWFFVTEQAN